MVKQLITRYSNGARYGQEAKVALSQNTAETAYFYYVINLVEITFQIDLNALPSLHSRCFNEDKKKFQSGLESVVKRYKGYHPYDRRKLKSRLCLDLTKSTLSLNRFETNSPAFQFNVLMF